MRALGALGHRVTLLMPPWHTPEEAGRSWAEGASVRCEYVSLAGLRVPGAGHLAVAGRMARRATELKPDVIHAFKPKAYSGLAAAILRARERLARPYSLIMDTDDWEGEGGWNTLEPYSRAQRAVFALQERWGMAHADALTVASRQLETLALRSGLPPDRIRYLPNALDELPPAATSADDSAGDRGSGGRPPTILLYTRFFEFEVGQPLDVLAQVRLAVPSARLLVVGRGLFGEEEEFLRRAGERGLADAVDYRGWLAKDRIEAEMRAADVALYPFSDTLVNRSKSPVKLLELLGAGLAVVAHAVGEVAVVIEHDRSGLLVPAGDTPAMARAVADLLASAQRRKALGRGARERIAADYIWRGRVTDLERVYRRAVAGE
jgi:glycosyltransferase involved in cell wall biosynthesis